MVGEGGLSEQGNFGEAALAQQLLHADPALWEPCYGLYDGDSMVVKLNALQQALRDHVPADLLERDSAASLEFIKRIFTEYENPIAQNSSFAFMVPPRTRRKMSGNSDPYKDEWGQLYPILRYVDSDTAQRFLVGTPPFVIDWYGPDVEEKRGCMLLAPIFADMFSDLGGYKKGFQQSARIMEDTLRFADNLGVATIGLGATLPKLDMLFQQLKIPCDDQGIRMTSGHPTTVWLMGELTKSLMQYGYDGLDGNIGLIGAGAIGMTYLSYIRAELHYTGEAHILDTASGKVQEAARLDERNLVASNLSELAGQLIVCAATNPIRLSSTDDLKGNVIVDDSQPGSFDPNDVRSHNGQVLWVMGQDHTYTKKDDTGEFTPKSFTYGGTGPAERWHSWGCQIEAWLVHRFPELATRGPVRPQHIRRLAQIAINCGVTLAPFQAQGQYVEVTPR